MLYLISLGSNERPHENLALAHRRLSEQFPDIRYSAVYDTPPLFFRHNTAHFCNQVACFHSMLLPAVVKACLKAIEVEAGREPSDKQNEVVKLDIDLLACDLLCYKPDDCQRDYVRRGIEELELTI
ncbi:MAG: 2-amino-4-hydroxy-6-hydroxymethyldihydropteridine diphosphokinase [Bacteroides sp.]